MNLVRALAETNSGLREYGAAFALGAAPASAVIEAASERVAECIGGEPMVVLASLYGDTDHWIVRDALNDVLVSLGQSALAADSDEVRILCMRVVCRSYLTGQMSVRALTSWAHATITHQGPPIAQDLVELDDELDSYCVRARHVDREIRAEAANRVAAFLRATA